MTLADNPHIVDLADHPDVEALRLYDHPSMPLQRYPAILTAKAWLGEDLVCFFTGFHDDDLFVLIFRKTDGYNSMHNDGDMRVATIGSTFKLSTGSVNRASPRVEAAEPMRAFP